MGSNTNRILFEVAAVLPILSNQAHSCRSAISGSMAVTWGAGIKQATAATERKIREMTQKVRTSVGLVANSNEKSSRVITSEPKMPIIAPVRTV